MSPFKKVVAGAVILLVSLVLGVVLYAVALSEAPPEGKPGPEADALAQRMRVAVHADAWDRTRAVQWNFAGRQQHLWDRHRWFARVRWDNGRYEALVDLDDKTGVVRRDGTLMSGPESDALVQKAWAFWANDSFWLNPVAKTFEEGVVREIVDLPQGGQGLLVRYEGAGGVTPGDAYLWVPGEDDVPSHWKMWVKIIPVGGVEASWDGWIALRTGAKVSTSHELGPLTIELTDVEGAATLQELVPGADPFAELVAP
jgi:hypothetical protein